MQREAPVTVTDRPPFDAGIAWRISVEMPLAFDVDAVRRPLEELGVAVLERRTPEEMIREARRALASEWGEQHVAWCEETLQRMQDEYRMRLAYLADALRDLDRFRRRSAIATHAACRLAERLVLESQLRADALEPLELALATGEVDANEAIEQLAIAAGRRLDIPSDELTRAMHRAAAKGLRTHPPLGAAAARSIAAVSLATQERRNHVVDWANATVCELSGCRPLLATALGEAIERSRSLAPADDPLWRGAICGAILQHEAWRLDGPHSNDLHPILGPV